MVVVSSTFSAPASGIIYQTPDTKLLVNDQDLGTATLYVTEHNVVWGGGVLPSGTAAPTVTLLYPHISLHAVQRDPYAALYMVLNYELRLPQLQQQGDGDAPAAAAEDDDEEFDADVPPYTQIRFVPPNEEDLASLYQAMNDGQKLHPDPDDEAYMDGEDVDEGDEEEFEDAEESDAVGAGAGAGAGAGGGVGGVSAEETAARLRQMRLDNSNGTSHYEDNDPDEAIDE